MRTNARCDERRCNRGYRDRDRKKKSYGLCNRSVEEGNTLQNGEITRYGSRDEIEKKKMIVATHMEPRMRLSLIAVNVRYL